MEKHALLVSKVWTGNLLWVASSTTMGFDLNLQVISHVLTAFRERLARVLLYVTMRSTFNILPTDIGHVLSLLYPTAF